jgi:hypothetical protein
VDSQSERPPGARPWAPGLPPSSTGAPRSNLISSFVATKPFAPLMVRGGGRTVAIAPGLTYAPGMSGTVITVRPPIIR